MGGGWCVVVDVTGMSSPDARNAARRLKRIVARHEPFNRRTGTLSKSAYVQYYRAMNRIVVGARAHYAEYLNRGTPTINGNPFVRDAVLEVFPDQTILFEGIIGT